MPAVEDAEAQAGGGMSNWDGFFYLATMLLIAFILWNHDRRIRQLRADVNKCTCAQNHKFTT